MDAAARGVVGLDPVVGDDGPREFAAARADEDAAAVVYVGGAAGDCEAADLRVGVVDVEDAEERGLVAPAEAAEDGVRRAVRGVERRRGRDLDGAREVVHAVRDFDFNAGDVRGGVRRGVQFLDGGDDVLALDDAQVVLADGGEGLAVVRDGERDGVEAVVRDGAGGLGVGAEGRLVSVAVRERPRVRGAGAEALDGGREGDGVAGEGDHGRGGEADGALGLVVFVAADVRRGALDAGVAGEVEGAETGEGHAAVAERRGGLHGEVAVRRVGEGGVGNRGEGADGLREGAVHADGGAVGAHVGRALGRVVRGRVAVGGAVADLARRAVGVDAAAGLSGRRVAIDGAVVHLRGAADADATAAVLCPVVRDETVFKEAAGDADTAAVAVGSVLLVLVTRDEAAVHVGEGGVHGDAAAGGVVGRDVVVGDDAVREFAAIGTDVTTAAAAGGD